VKLPSLLLALVFSTAAAQQPSPDIIYAHGNILTGTRLQPGDKDPIPGHVEALAVFAGRVLAVGDDKTILALKAANTQVIDLHGAFVMPGFNDAHTHTASAGQQRLELDLDNVSSLAAMQDKIRTYAATLAPGQWILGGGWDHTKWASKKLPTRRELDTVSAGHPLYLERTDGHIAIANTAALKASGITADTPNPQGGAIDHDADGQPTGIIREGPALSLLAAHIPPPSYETRRKALELSIHDALSHGVTSIQDFSDWNDWLI
jgi:predicted amidohydrolase YtcJ